MRELIDRIIGVVLRHAVKLVQFARAIAGIVYRVGRAVDRRRSSLVQDTQ